MFSDQKTTYIDLKNVSKIARGNTDKMYNYLHQFRVLIPERSQKLREHLAAENRLGIRQILHNMSPQVQFFGVPEVVAPIKRLELEYESIPLEDLRQMVELILNNLHKALVEVETIIANNFE